MKMLIFTMLLETITKFEQKLYVIFWVRSDWMKRTYFYIVAIIIVAVVIGIITGLVLHAKENLPPPPPPPIQIFVDHAKLATVPEVLSAVGKMKAIQSVNLSFDVDGKITNIYHTSGQVKKGDIVLFTKYGPHEVKVGDKEYLIVRQDDILAIVE